jgi:hypothetical protein
MMGEQGYAESCEKDQNEEESSRFHGVPLMMHPETF